MNKTVVPASYAHTYMSDGCEVGSELKQLSRFYSLQ